MISIIIPTLNEEKYIERCLLSLSLQDYDDPFEIIIVDSMSKDRTVEIAKKFGKVILTKRKGAGYARNLGAKKAKGDILIFLDADTFVARNFLKEMDKAFKDGIIAATCPVLLDDPGRLHYLILGNALNRILIKMKFGFFPGIVTAVRKDVFLEVGGYPNIWPSEDIELSLKLRKVKGEFAYVANTFVVSSARRDRKYGRFGTLKAFRKWFFGYFIDRKIFKREVQYEPIR